MRKARVLFLCVGNTARSQMAEAFLRAYGGDRFEAHSAGLKPRAIEPAAITVMQEVGFELRGHRPKHLKEFVGRLEFDYLIIVCNRAERICPRFAGMGRRLSWPFQDPTTFEGTEEERLAKFRQLRDGIERFIRAWLGDLPAPERTARAG